MAYVQAGKFWYTEHRTYWFDFDNAQDLIEKFSRLPDDGFLAGKIWYNSFSGKNRHARNISGDEWYYVFLTPDGEVGIDHGSGVTKAEIEQRYPGAVIKRGKATSESDMARVSEELANATFWGDPALNPQVGGNCCGD